MPADAFVFRQGARVYQPKPARSSAGTHNFCGLASPWRKQGFRRWAGLRAHAMEARPEPMPAMPPLPDSLAKTPELFPFGLDVGTDSLTFLQLGEADLAKASFLDQRIRTPGSPTHTIPFAEAQAAISESGLPESADFIFHIGHVGSTLLSRLLGRHAAILSLREPAILRTLAQIRTMPESVPSRWSAEAFEAHLATLLKLWSRTFRPEQRTLIKATSFASELAPEILARPYQPKAIFMTVMPEIYLATILGADNSPKEAQMLADLRAKRLQHRIGSVLEPIKSMGELVAMSWASEMCALTAALPQSRERILWLDFDRFLADPATALAACFAHLGRAASSEDIAAILSGPDMRHYSKAPEHAYDAQLRADVLNQAYGFAGAEIKRGMAWLEKVAASNAVIAEALSRSA